MQTQSHDPSSCAHQNAVTLAETAADMRTPVGDACSFASASTEAEARLFRKTAIGNVERLTALQSRVLDLLLAGRAPKEIATALKMSQRSVYDHRTAIARQLEALSEADVIHAAVCGRCAIREPDSGAEPAGSGAPTAALSHAALTAEDLVRLDMREVSHRLKNFAAVIQSISHQTARSATSVTEFDKVFSARLRAFCSSLDALVAGDWSNLGMAQLVAMQLAPFGLGDGEQISAVGPEVSLQPAAAHAIGMALHELATNAVKYGALSVAEGRVTLDWRIEVLAGRTDLIVNWHEMQGPKVTAPAHHGFGLQVIQKLTALALHATVTHEFHVDGVFWQLRCDTHHLRAIAESPVSQRADAALYTAA